MVEHVFAQYYDSIYFNLSEDEFYGSTDSAESYNKDDLVFVQMLDQPQVCVPYPDDIFLPIFTDDNASSIETQILTPLFESSDESPLSDDVNFMFPYSFNVASDEAINTTTSTSTNIDETLHYEEKRRSIYLTNLNNTPWPYSNCHVNIVKPFGICFTPYPLSYTENIHANPSNICKKGRMNKLNSLLKWFKDGFKKLCWNWIWILEMSFLPKLYSVMKVFNNGLIFSNISSFIV